MAENEKYVVIAEWKDQSPIIMETEIYQHGTLEQAYERQTKINQNANCIRTCIARLVYQSGNEALLPKTTEEN